MAEDSQLVAPNEQIRTRVEYIPPQAGPLIASPSTYQPPAETQLEQSANQLSALPATKGLAQTFGLHVTAATFTILVDVMVFGSDLISAGVLIPLEIAAGGIVGFTVYTIQKHWYGDDHQSALIKAMIVGLLTAIPSPLSPVIAVPAGLVGLVKTIRRR